MDWSAKMLGLSDDFLLEKKKGGGVIMVCRAELRVSYGGLTPGFGVRVGFDGGHGGARAGAGSPGRAGADGH